MSVRSFMVLPLGSNQSSVISNPALTQSEPPLPFHSISPAMGEKCRGKLDHVARLEPVPGKQFCGEFHAGNAPKSSVETGKIHQPYGRLIHHRLESGADARANG